MNERMKKTNKIYKKELEKKDETIENILGAVFFEHKHKNTEENESEDIDLYEGLISKRKRKRPQFLNLYDEVKEYVEDSTEGECSENKNVKIVLKKKKKKKTVDEDFN
jgi:hypothetical protein